MDKLDEKVANVVQLLGNPTRLTMLLLLLEGESMNATTLQQVTGLNQSKVSISLGRLLDRGLVNGIRKGKERFYSLTDSSILEAVKPLLKGNTIPPLNELEA